MTSVVRIANMALSHLGGRGRIGSLTEASEEARQCALHYDAARDETLASANWPFAAKTKALALSLEKPGPGFARAFEYPGDCLAPRALFCPGKNEPLRFATGVSDDLSRRLVYADVLAPVLFYTARVTNPALYDPMFVTAFSLRLASAVAIPLTGKYELAESLMALASRAMAGAMAASANQSFGGPEPDAEWIRARG